MDSRNNITSAISAGRGIGSAEAIVAHLRGADLVLAKRRREAQATANNNK
jgi:hypothetical protein